MLAWVLTFAVFLQAHAALEAALNSATAANAEAQKWEPQCLELLASLAAAEEAHAALQVSLAKIKLRQPPSSFYLIYFL